MSDVSERERYTPVSLYDCASVCVQICFKKPKCSLNVDLFVFIYWNTLIHCQNVFYFMICQLSTSTLVQEVWIIVVFIYLCICVSALMCAQYVRTLVGVHSVSTFACCLFYSPATVSACDCLCWVMTGGATGGPAHPRPVPANQVLMCGNRRGLRWQMAGWPGKPAPFSGFSSRQMTGIIS